MDNSSTPRRTTRRADRYKQQSGVTPSTELLERTTPPAPPDESPTPPAAVSALHRTHYRQVTPTTADTPSPAEDTPVSREPDDAHSPRRQPAAEDRALPPTAMERPANAPQRKKQPPKRKVGFRMPAWLTASLIGALVLMLALFTAQSLMSAYLTRQEQARQDAYAKVVAAHPIYFKDLIEQYADENNLRPAYVAAIILNESSFRTDAESSVGARGLMQLMPATAEWIAGKLDIEGYSFDRMYDAETNIRFGTWYLGYLSKLFRGDPVLVTSAYHAGQGEVTGWLSDPAMSQDGVTLEIANMQDGPTKTYAGRVTQAYGIYEALYFTTTQALDSTAALPVLDIRLSAVR